MKPFSIRVNRIIDAGTIVSLIGVDADTGKPVTVHVDYRPFDIVWLAWRDAGTPQPIEYAAEGLTLNLDLSPKDTDAPSRETANNARPNRFHEALQIVGPGASNLSGIAHAIVAACAEVCREAGSVAHDPAVRLMVSQLAWVCRVNNVMGDYGQLLAECRSRVTAEQA
jgi:hypothetical protein